MRKYLSISIILLGILFVFNSCDFFNFPGTTTTVTPESRLNLFTSDLNSTTRSDLYEHVHSGATLYQQINDPAWWDENVFSQDNRTFTFEVAYVSEASGTRVYSGTMTHANATFDCEISFRERTLGSNVWYIYNLSLDSTDIIY